MIEELAIKVDEMEHPVQSENQIDVSALFSSAGGFNEALQAKLAETLAGSANDLTGLVRKKEKPTTEAGNVVGEKRKIEGIAVVGSPGKKVRVEDIEDEG